MSNGDVLLSAILLERGIAAGLSIATISVSAFGGSFQLKKAAKFGKGNKLCRIPEMQK